METVDIRKELHQYIEEGDERLIKMIHAMVKVYQNDVELLKEMKNMDERSLESERTRLIMNERKQHLKGEGKTYTWEEVKQSILTNKRL